MKVSEIKTNQINLIVGTVAYFGRSSVPKGWLECNGASLIRNDFIDLFNIIGTTYGSVDANSFNLPDLRGEFIRCWDNGRGVDKYPTYTYGGSTTESNRQFNSNVQSYATKTLTGQMYKISETWAYGGGGGSGPFWKPHYGGWNSWNTPNGSDGSNSGILYFDSSKVSSSSLGETRPRNIALLLCIKY
jgi:phage-related tail fiber protein